MVVDRLRKILPRLAAAVFMALVAAGAVWAVPGIRHALAVQRHAREAAAREPSIMAEWTGRFGDPQTLEERFPPSPDDALAIEVAARARELGIELHAPYPAEPGGRLHSPGDQLFEALLKYVRARIERASGAAAVGDRAGIAGRAGSQPGGPDAASTGPARRRVRPQSRRRGRRGTKEPPRGLEAERIVARWLERASIADSARGPVVFEERPEDELSLGGILAGFGMPNAAHAWRKADRLRLETELTLKVLEARRARRRDGRWPADVGGIETSLLGEPHWVYAATNGRMRIALSAPVEWKADGSRWSVPLEFASD
jgi:hypothetical protein